jgi:hypothetical protein
MISLPRPGAPGSPLLDLQHIGYGISPERVPAGDLLNPVAVTIRKLLMCRETGDVPP